MSSKSKKQRRHRESNSIKRRPLMKQLRSRDLPRGLKGVSQHNAREKMSEVVLEFVEPYRQLAIDQHAFDRLIAIAILAWNAAFLDETDRRDLIDQAVETAIPDDDEQARAGVRQIMNDLIERKKRHFAGCKRVILHYQLSETQDGFHLSVASTLDRGGGDWE